MSFNQDKWIETAARTGLTAKGVVYSLVGILTFMAAFEMGSGDDKGGKSQALNWIEEQPFGQVLLGFVAVGLLCYSVWRLVEAFLDTEDKGNDAKGLAVRSRYVFSGLVYGASTYYAAKLLFGSTSGDGGGDTRETVAQKLLEQPFGQWLVGIVAVGVMAVGVYQIYYSVSDKHRKKIQESKLDNRVKETLLASGKVGYIARGIVWLLIGYLFLQAALQSDSSEAGGSDSAFSFLEQQWGSWVLAVVALGLLCYGIFMFVRARYQPVNTR
ncbi:DUF1206 domain-containing protein [Persicitalea jodogahamensis]|uniref:DUF1206 domain-containing protein n=1 Tax=Persicitalea jodogahamensis TaxID=402147 RepID=A0A8J3D7I5_9BACT|nr:DUF1206 domain-containing protein [Persicitalea jodogahamensis]GHB85026.1 hypothetical protein GCM10007390_45370 [Persicitalea jodogahamensis]